MARPMLGDLELQQVQVVGVDQDRVLAEHAWIRAGAKVGE